MVRTRALRPAAFAGLLLAAVLGGLALAPAAFAHHPDISGTSACDKTVTFTSTAWVAGTSAERTNPRIAIAYAVNGGSYTTLAQKATYRYDSGNRYTFTDTFTPPSGWTSLTLRATAVARWADGAAAGDTRTSSRITPATGCTPPTTTPPTTTPPTTAPPSTTTTQPPSTTPTTAPPSTTTTTPPPTTSTTVRPATVTPEQPASPSATVDDTACTDHRAVAHLVNTGEAPVDFTVQVGSDAATTVTVPGNGHADVPVTLPSATTTVTVTAPGMATVTHAVEACATAAPQGEVLGAEATAPPVPAPAAAPASGGLPITGAPLLVVGGLALTALLAGLGLVLTGRRRSAA